LPESSAIESAVIGLLAADAALTSLMPGGVWYQLAPPNTQQFVIVSMADSADQQMFGGRAWESVLYLVKAVEFSSLTVPNKNARAAAERIDALLDPQPPAPPATLTITGYGTMLMQREGRRVRDVETDEKDATIQWAHRGAHYRVMVTATTP
jgi:hypothetical protein